MNQNKMLKPDSHCSESWRVFRIMSEMVDAIDTLNCLDKKCISIFGSARSTENSKIYKDTEKIARLLVENGYGIISGGGPGTMEAANKGAFKAGGTSVGLHINLPHEQSSNKYITTKCSFDYFFIRKFMFIKYAMAYIVMPGGIGTLDELSEALVMVQTGRIKPFPIILYDAKFWAGLLNWINSVLVENEYVTAEEIKNLITVCDNPEEVVNYIKKIVIL